MQSSRSSIKPYAYHEIEIKQTAVTSMRLIIISEELKQEFSLLT